MGTLLLLLSTIALMTLCFSSADMASASDGDGLQQGGHGTGLATKRHYDLYGIHFDFDKAVIQPDSNALLDDIVDNAEALSEVAGSGSLATPTQPEMRPTTKSCP